MEEIVGTVINLAFQRVCWGDQGAHCELNALKSNQGASAQGLRISVTGDEHGSECIYCVLNLGY